MPFTTRAALTSLALAAALVLAVTGCARGPETGAVTVEVRADATTGAPQTLDVEVRDARGTVLAAETMSSGTTLQFDGIPFGEVSIEAIGLCELGTTLDAAGATAIFEPKHCTIE
ncbi:hypothetical protein [Microterricola pindariensis]|uniref:EfeO-type cupredoxin-like domain-containing protein n=1 Tax=Microterricola pindariensis TaxID=478010 RepID=A0ABX5AUP5_9MICO|nr:hypothetical protein [Microterricola pindariensis]PPL18661.1 hypothetical protein GY24_09950 [Microterricola pindariensis]